MQNKEDPTLQLLIALMGVFYFVITFTLALYGFHNLITTILYLGMKPMTKHKTSTPMLKEWPRVTFNFQFLTRNIPWSVYYGRSLAWTIQLIVCRSRCWMTRLTIRWTWCPDWWKNTRPAGPISN